MSNVADEIKALIETGKIWFDDDHLRGLPYDEIIKDEGAALFIEALIDMVEHEDDYFDILESEFKKYNPNNTVIPEDIAAARQKGLLGILQEKGINSVRLYIDNGQYFSYMNRIEAGHVSKKSYVDFQTGEKVPFSWKRTMVHEMGHYFNHFCTGERDDYPPVKGAFDETISMKFANFIQNTETPRTVYPASYPMDDSSPEQAVTDEELLQLLHGLNDGNRPGYDPEDDEYNTVLEFAKQHISSRAVLTFELNRLKEFSMRTYKRDEIYTEEEQIYLNTLAQDAGIKLSFSENMQDVSIAPLKNAPPAQNTPTPKNK